MKTLHRPYGAISILAHPFPILQIEFFLPIIYYEKSKDPVTKVPEDCIHVLSEILGRLRAKRKPGQNEDINRFMLTMDAMIIMKDHSNNQIVNQRSEHLVSVLKDKFAHEEDRAIAAQILGVLTTKSELVVEALQEATVQKESELVQVYACEALLKLGDGDSRSIGKILMKGKNSDNSDIKIVSTRSLPLVHFTPQARNDLKPKSSSAALAADVVNTFNNQ